MFSRERMHTGTPERHDQLLSLRLRVPGSHTQLVKCGRGHSGSSWHVLEMT